MVVMWQLVFGSGSVVGSAGLVGGGEAVAAGLADGFAAALVFVFGGDVADRYEKVGSCCSGP